MRTGHAFQLLCLAIVLLIASACRERTGARTENGPPLKGRLILYTKSKNATDQIYEIRNDPTSGKAVFNAIAGNVYDYALSPDGKNLLFTSAGLGLFRRMMDTGEVIKVVPHDASSPNWSPDGTRFCYVDNLSHELVVANLSGESQVITKAISQIYTLFGGYVEHPTPNYGSITGAFWVTADRIVFQRFKGPFPEAVSANEADFPANATALAVVTGKPSVIDAPLRLFVGPQCPKKSMVMFRGDYNSDSLQSRLPYFATNFIDFEKTKLRRLPQLGSGVPHYPQLGRFCWNCDEPLRFTDNTCQLYYVKSSERQPMLGGPSQNDISFLDSESLQDRTGISLGDNRSFYDAFISPDEKMIALAFHSGGHFQVSIRDLNTGAETILPLVSSQGTDSFVRQKFVAWLPD